jgi:hypothetical protein
MPDQPYRSPEPGDADTEERAAVPAPVAPQAPADYDPAYTDDFDDESRDDELPARPRRRLLAPIPVALLAVLMAACGFLVGVLVEKGQGPSGSGTSVAGLAARFASLRAGATGASGASGAAGAAGAFGARAGGFFGGAAGASADGEISFVEGETLYVVNSEGNTVKVKTSPGATITKTVTAKVAGIHPGETVVATGTTGADGVIEADSIRVGSSGGQALFGGG